MQTFLSEAARYVFDRHPLDALSRLCVVLPSRRAVYFFKLELARLADRPFLAPEILAMDDFILLRGDRKQADPVSLLFELYDVFKEIEPELDFDRFTSWAPVVLRDFDQIDLYLGNAKGIFGWVQAEKALERWPGAPPAGEGSATVRYFRLFENLFRVYTELQKRLEEKGLAYRGMAYRNLATEVDKVFFEKPVHDFHYFLGFNALSRSEETILRKLTGTGRAEALWDADFFYLRPGHEAGRFLRNYLADPDLGRGEWNRRFRDQDPSTLLLRTSAKQVTDIGVPNTTMQPKVAAWQLEDWLRKGLPEAAVVLGDENLLIPMLSSLPAGIEDFNVTMGVSLRQSPLFTLVESLFELQQSGIRSGSKPAFPLKHLIKVLGHPFLQRSRAVAPFLQELRKGANVFVREEEIRELAKGDQLLTLIFTRWEQDSRRATRQLYSLIDALRPLYEGVPDAVETEYLYEFYTILKRLEGILNERREPVSITSFRRFLFELIRQTKIPFSGEPVAPLQLMGMLETRCLDFERVVVLSVNEGVLPTGKKQNSLIPFDAAQEFGLPTYVDADAVMSYHFFRLLQRAKEVVLVHTVPAGEGAKAEPSRFLLQIEHELAKLNPNLSWGARMAEFVPEVPRERPETELVVPKSPEIREEILDRLAKKGIYATHLNMYYQCSLKYYFSRIAGIAEEEEQTESLEANDFGTWVHEVLEQIDREMIREEKRRYTREDYERFTAEIPQRLTTIFKENFPRQVMDEGRNLLLFNVARRILTHYFAFRQAELEAGKEVVVLAPEQKLQASFDYRGRPLLVAGKIDRLEQVNGDIRIVDYKTGKVDPRSVDVSDSLSPEELQESFLSNDDWGYLRQLWLYKYLVLKQNHRQVGGVDLSADQTVRPGIISFRNLAAGFMAQENLRFSEETDAATFLAESEVFLTAFVDELMDETKPFRQTDDRDTCQYCDFVRICERD
ncbi:PD-(D/E)XK nuclease family protein [Siphonobacter aquaeclarae]|uniref:PD-(D/E)XK nuclease superfamily protein n=1 Tax=Siphonobacter aquaeclarae TaxID=563176 RepID=A0A1G9RE70_9BACT|nr:PD-(D/E)XK nuclease family protein [Siphonobacter aquaeclarae]SDM21548.1 PD-(D/E)XK nuclease superfamily protein [Siphonobacter aquaeclarae]